MSLFDWFKPKNKRNVVVPTPAMGQLQGVELIQKFSTEDEPKLKDFPKEKYKVYWETFLNPIPGGYSALVRFYSFDGGFLLEKTLSAINVDELRFDVSAFILDTMSKNKR
jgi:hypothetical protein